MIPVILGGGFVGLLLILLPRQLMLFGTRWTLRDGETAEPSGIYVIYVRVMGVVFLIATAATAFWMHSIDVERQTRDQLEELWDVRLLSGEEVVLILDPVVDRVDSFPDALRRGEVTLSPVRSAVVGQDELGNIGDVSQLEDGDLVIATGYSACPFSRLIVAEHADRVSVWIVGELPVVDAPDLDPLAAWTLCSRRFPSESGDAGLTVIRVPLDAPLGDRTLD